MLSDQEMIQEDVNEIISNSENSDEIIEKSCEYFDSLCLYIKKKRGEPLISVIDN